MGKDNSDLDLLICETEAMSQNPANDEANRRFADTRAGQVSDLLRELKEWRESAARKEGGSGRIIIEGYDEESAQAAFADALNKAACFFNEHQDISIMVLGLHALPHGGHRVKLEVTVTPVSLRLTRHPDSLDVEAKRAHERSFNKFRKHEDVHLQELVYEHFLETSGCTPHVPNYFLINFKDADLLNHMIEKEFFGAGHKKRALQQSQPEPPQAVVKFRSS